MPPKKQSPGEPPKPNKFKFVYIEADLSETNFSELTSTIAQVMRPTALPSRLADGKSQAQITQDKSSETEPDEILDAEYVDETPAPSEHGTAAKAPRSPRTKKSKPPTYLPDLITDIDGYKKFAREKAPDSKNQQYLVAAYWLKEFGHCPIVNADKIYTCYKTAQWPAGFNDWSQTFHNLVHAELMRKTGNKGEFAINPTGEEAVRNPKA